MGMQAGFTFDSHGRKITWGEPNDSKAKGKAFEGCPFVTLMKEDAQNILSILSEVVDTRKIIDNNDPRCISFERLVDYVGGTVY